MKAEIILAGTSSGDSDGGASGSGSHAPFRKVASTCSLASDASTMELSGTQELDKAWVEGFIC